MATHKHPLTRMWAIPGKADLKNWYPNRPPVRGTLVLLVSRLARDMRPKGTTIPAYVNESIKHFLNMRIPHPLPNYFTPRRLLIDMNKWLILHRWHAKDAKIRWRQGHRPYDVFYLETITYLCNIDLTNLERVKILMPPSFGYSAIINSCMFFYGLVQQDLALPGELPPFWRSPGKIMSRGDHHVITHKAFKCRMKKIFKPYDIMDPNYLEMSDDKAYNNILEGP